MNRYHYLLLCVLLIAASILWAETSPGEAVLSVDSPIFADSLKIPLNEKSQLDSLFYTADSVRAYYEEERIYLYGNTTIDYQDSNIAADSLMIDLKKEQAKAWGKTKMRDGDQFLIGYDVLYDVRTQTGILANGQSYIENGYYSGEEIRKVDKSIYDIDGGSFTTCDLAEPSYWFWAKRMRIYQKDKVVGKHVFAYVNHFPVFYFPFITMSIKRGRQAGFLIPEPGYNSSDGKYIRDLAWYYPYQDLADFTIGMDLMEKTGWKLNLKTIYTQRYMYNGGFSASYQKNKYSTGTSYDWALRGNHHHELPEKSALDVALDFVSNKRIWESSDDLNESLAQRLTSSISYRKPLGSTYLNAGAIYSQDLINDTATINLPSASWSLPTRPLYEIWKGNSSGWYSGLTYYYNVRLDHTGIIRAKNPAFGDYFWDNSYDPDNPANYLNEHHLGMKHSMGLSNSYKYRGWLNLRQGVDYSEAWYDRDKNDNKWVRGYDYSASLNSSFNLYGIRNFNTGPLRSIRHTLTPAIGLSFAPDFTDNADLYSFGGISLRNGTKQATLGFSLDQKWQMKYGEAKNPKKLNDFISLNSRVGANLYKDEKKLGNISHSVGFKPGTIALGDIGIKALQLDGLKLGYGAQLSLTQDTYKISFDDPAFTNQYFSHNITFSGSTQYKDYFIAPKNQAFSEFGGTETNSATTNSDISNAFSLGISHDLYAPKSIFEPTTQNLRANTSLKLTNNYSVTYDNYYNVKEKKLIAQGIHIIRDLHCWKLDFTFSKRNEYWDYRIVFFNTQFPEALRFQTRDSKRY